MNLVVYLLKYRFSQGVLSSKPHVNRHALSNAIGKLIDDEFDRFYGMIEAESQSHGK